MELLFRGKKLDLSSGKFGSMRSSNDILNHLEAQKQRMKEDGYLLFRKLIPEHTVLEARREIMLKYAVVGEIDSINYDVMDAIQQMPSFIDQINLLAFTESIRTGKAYNDVIMSANLIGFFERFLGGKVATFDFKWPRFVRPGEGTGIHSDIVYIGRGTKNLWSAWIPIGGVALEEGPLIILEGSHLSTKLDRYWAADADRDKIGWLSDDPLSIQEELGGRWLTTEFGAGDVICFDTRLVHGSLDNVSPKRRCRLTSDTRYQLARDPLDDRWNGDISNPHGGRQKAFVPGIMKATGNEEFEEEWKPVDERGRLASSLLGEESV
ncbi:phytanoyl-CoA dioxygenase family protein [Paraburkholderia lacunae]|uniref:Phytanoyl-CoA dioxygenase n=1 Tax=Paraburkholderia lacunae TaxID=2211104 RepID=A0A370NC85_9BURK|nr:phytanoyl-CoA dioxygenase family protein [Paraburkholderia lacunae]RDK03203.1 phytanoyl-CoA dioxygenase [Paraburkholderia lacunae]